VGKTNIAVVAAALASTIHLSAHGADSFFVSSPMPSAGPKRSEAADLPTYRVDGAKHIYESYPHRVYRGKLPPLVHAIVVVETVIGSQGELKEINVIRAPSHAPDVTEAVREMIKRIAPFPTPTRMDGVRYTETWLMDKSGRFQVDTLSEGQL
jgi:hypothetical protein